MECLRGMKEYLRQLKRSLNCPWSHRRRFLSETRRMAEDYCQGHLSAAPEDIYTFLGGPKELAQTFLDSLDQEALARYQQRTCFLCRGLATLLVTALIGVSLWGYRLWANPAVIEVSTTLIIYEEGEIL